MTRYTLLLTALCLAACASGADGPSSDDALLGKWMDPERPDGITGVEFFPDGTLVVDRDEASTARVVAPGRLVIDADPDGARSVDYALAEDPSGADALTLTSYSGFGSPEVRRFVRVAE